MNYEWLAEEDAGNGEGRYDANEIGNQATSYCVAGVFDAYTSKVNC